LAEAESNPMKKIGFHSLSRWTAGNSAHPPALTTLGGEMSLNIALAISLGVLGAIAAWLFLGPLGGALQIWAAFIAWGCFFHCGGKEPGLQTTIINNAVGAIVGGITLIAAGASIGASLPPAVWAGICVGIGVAVMVLLANIPLFSAIPAQVYGFASVVALTLLGNGGGNLMAASMANPVIVIILSMIAGAIFGYVSEKIAGMLVGSGSARTAKA
jgi:Protein of unknown function (DUF1097)